MAADCIARRAMRFADGEVVWSWRLDAGVNPVTMLTHYTGDGDKKADHQREHEANRKLIAQGMPECFGEPVVTTLACFFHLHARLRVRQAPGIPCALFIRGTMSR